MVNVTLDNQDAGVSHDVTFFDPAGTRVAGTEIAAGPNVSSATFTPVAAGNYSFKCTVHPLQMTGTLTVQ
jgi:plastocyanin